ncbi:MAG: NfeD family protein [Planctomycetales bacterium]
MTKRIILQLLVAAGFAALSAAPLRAQDETAEEAPKETVDAPKDASEQDPVEPEQTSDGPVARYITVTNPAGELVFSRVRNALIELQHQAELEDRDNILILEIETGSSTFGQVSDLAKELTSSKYSRVRTVAWIPKDESSRPLTGYTAIIALACREIVMHPDAEIGDVGRGTALDDDEQLSIINLVEKRYNTKVNGALAAGFVEPSRTVLKIKVISGEDANRVTETRVVTSEEMQRLQESDVAIPDVITIKEKGDVLLLSGKRARQLDILVMQTAEDRVDLAELYGFDRRYLRESLTTDKPPRARIIKIDGVIDPILHEYVEREIRRAVAEDANLIIFEIESPGGYLAPSEQLADRISKLDGKKHRTVAYIPDGAYSGAAIIAMGCDDIYLHPEAKIGDAGPIEMRPGQPFERAPEKVLSPLRETMKVLAKRKGRPPALLEAMADKDLRVFEVTHSQTGRKFFMSEAEIEASGGEWIKGALVPESREDNLLTVIGRRAHDLKLANEPVHDMGELRQRLGIPANAVVPVSAQTWVDALIFRLKTPEITFLLFMVGLICIYLEVYTVSGFFGIGGALCFAIFFWSRFLGGTAGWLEVTLFIFGIALIAMEIFVIPGFGVFGLSGGLAVIASLILASQTFVIPSTSAEFDQFSWTIGTLSSSIVAVVAVGAVLSHFMPRIPGLRGFVLAAPGTVDDGGPLLNPDITGDPSQTLQIGENTSLLSQTGTAFSTLRPSGKAHINGTLVDVVSAGEFIDPGTPIEVVEVAGNRVVVRAVT